MAVGFLNFTDQLARVVGRPIAIDFPLAKQTSRELVDTLFARQHPFQLTVRYA
jgi:hypothetical protein